MVVGDALRCFRQSGSREGAALRESGIRARVIVVANHDFGRHRLVFDWFDVVWILGENSTVFSF
jgi:hypothetical protein